ncbi:glycosyltransferase family 4 protein [Patescibacteria group bacterium]|nr:glycosyltransferase family 4 protein [Patescibacteria group bacterium]
MRIGWDLRCLPADGSPGAGIPHAARELWNACLDLAPQYDLELIAFAAKKAALEERGNVTRLSSLRAWSFLRAVKSASIDKLFFPSGTVPLGVSLPAIPWIHDLAIVDHPEWFPESALRRLFTTSLVRRGIQGAPIVFAVSQATAHQITTWTHCPSEKIIVTKLGIDLPKEREPLPEILLQEPYALVLGSVEPRKNHAFLVTIWPEVCRRLGKKIPLVIAGREGWGATIAFPSEVIRIPDVSDPLRATLLAHAGVVLVPSLYEGFGLTAAEAIVSGAPVITSNRGALPEVVQQTGCILPLEQPDAWIDVIVQLFANKKIQEAWRSSSRAHAADFSWTPIAHTVLANLSKY